MSNWKWLPPADLMHGISVEEVEGCVCNPLLPEVELLGRNKRVLSCDLLFRFFSLDSSFASCVFDLRALDFDPTKGACLQGNKRSLGTIFPVGSVTSS